MDTPKKRNVTLSVDEDTVRKAKSSLALSGKTMSEVLEEALEGHLSEFQINSLASKLGIKLRRMSSIEIKKRRPRAPEGFNSSSAIKEMRASRI